MGRSSCAVVVRCQERRQDDQRVSSLPGDRSRPPPAHPGAESGLWAGRGRGISGRGRPVGQDHDAGSEGPNPGQFQRCLTGLPEQETAVAGQDGMDREPELVDQAVLQQRVRQRAVTEQGEVRAVLLPEPGYLGCCVTPEDGRVVPAGQARQAGRPALRGQGMNLPGRSADLLPTAIRYILGSLSCVTPASLSSPTPCAAWDLAALLAHVSDSLAVVHDAIVTGCVSLELAAQ